MHIEYLIEVLNVNYHLQLSPLM